MKYYVGYRLPPGADENMWTEPTELELNRVTQGKNVISKTTERKDTDAGQIVRVVWETDEAEREEQL